MTIILEYSGKLTLSYQTRAEQLAINKLRELLLASPVEDLVYILDGYDARQAAVDSPWPAVEDRRKKS
jgi:hypothetical protein